MKNVTLMALLWGFITMNTHSSEEILIIDVRTIEEWNEGHINAAKHIEWQVISEKIFDLTSNFDSEIYLYCRSGNRSGKAKKILDGIGFTNVINAGGKEEASIMIDKIMQNDIKTNGNH